MSEALCGHCQDALWVRERNRFYKALDKQNAEMSDLRAEHAEMLEALKFYADGGLTPENLEMDSDRVPYVQVFDLPSLFERGVRTEQIIKQVENPPIKYKSGKRARQAITRIESAQGSREAK